MKKLWPFSKTKAREYTVIGTNPNLSSGEIARIAIHGFVAMLSDRHSKCQLSHFWCGAPVGRTMLLTADLRRFADSAKYGQAYIVLYLSRASFEEGKPLDTFSEGIAALRHADETASRKLVIQESDGPFYVVRWGSLKEAEVGDHASGLFDENTSQVASFSTNPSHTNPVFFDENLTIEVPHNPTFGFIECLDGTWGIWEYFPARGEIREVSHGSSDDNPSHIGI